MSTPNTPGRESGARAQTKKVTVPTLLKMKRRGERIAMLTAYDATFARILDDGGIDILLVGDSLGMVVQGHENTLPVTLDEIIYHTRAVKRGTLRAQVVADMPFMSYQLSPHDALTSAGRLVKEGGAEAVKLEGGATVAPHVGLITAAGIPVMGHIGLTPQSVHQMGGYKVQGKSDAAAKRLLDDARAIEDAGAYALVLEGIPGSLAAEITALLSIPTIGIGAGAECDGQVLVIYDMLGMNPDFKPKFVKHFDNLYERIITATKGYIREVRTSEFPAPEHTFDRLKVVREKKTQGRTG
ncbi:MAG: 3-methyl-2-oxobutanoate hydroxymethyltransferase [Myxococcales bacterium]|nr:3-methyl-2-oxobutanoate hydroxymethyltransferase [Myxococcales bacterium]